MKREAILFVVFSVLAFVAGTGIMIAGDGDSGFTNIVLTGNLTVDGTTTLATAPAITSLTANKAVVTDGSKGLASSATTATEIGYVNGVTSAIQTQINTKATGPASATDNALVRFDATTGKIIQNSSATLSDAGAAHFKSDVDTSGYFIANQATASRVAVFDGSKQLISSTDIDTTEIEYLNGVSSNVQDQITARIQDPGVVTDNAIVTWDGAGGQTVQDTLVTVDDSNNVYVPGTLTASGYITAATATANTAAYFDGTKQLVSSTGVSDTELGYIGGLTSDAQAQLDLKLDELGAGATTDHAIPRFDGTAGAALLNSLSTIDDSGNVFNYGTLTQSGYASFTTATASRTASFDGSKQLISGPGSWDASGNILNPADGVPAYAQSGGYDVWTRGDLQASGYVYSTSGFKLGDDLCMYFGSDNDASVCYDEMTDDQLEWTVLMFALTGDFGVNGNMTANTRADQAEAAAVLIQNDDDQAFIRIEGTIAADQTKNISSDNVMTGYVLAYWGKVAVNAESTGYWVPVYTHP